MVGRLWHDEGGAVLSAELVLLLVLVLAGVLSGAATIKRGLLGDAEAVSATLSREVQAFCGEESGKAESPEVPGIHVFGRGERWEFDD